MISAVIDESREEVKAQLFSEREAAQRLGVSRSTLHRSRQAGELGFYRISNRVLFSQAHLDDFLASVERKPQTKRAA